MDDLTAFQRDALYVIAGLDEPNGLEIKTQPIEIGMMDTEPVFSKPAMFPSYG